MRSRAGRSARFSASAAEDVEEEHRERQLGAHRVHVELAPEAAHRDLERLRRAARGERDRLAVEDQLARRQRPHRLDDLGHGRGHVVEVAREHAHFVAGLVDLHARAVELPVERGGAERFERARDVVRGLREHRLHRLEQRGCRTARDRSRLRRARRGRRRGGRRRTSPRAGRRRAGARLPARSRRASRLRARPGGARRRGAGRGSPARRASRARRARRACAPARWPSLCLWSRRARRARRRRRGARATPFAPRRSGLRRSWRSRSRACLAAFRPRGTPRRARSPPAGGAAGAWRAPRPSRAGLRSRRRAARR